MSGRMQVHELKTWPEAFEAVRRMRKHVELRYDDRGYQVGDVLVLREWEPEEERETGRWVAALVTHIVRAGEWPALSDGWVALSIRTFRMPRSV